MSKRKNKKNNTLKVSTLAANTTKLAKKPPLQTVESNKYEVDYFRLYESLYRKEISDWQQARIARHDPFNPITYPLQQLYKDAMLDNHLAGAIENRILRVVNKQFIIKNPDGKPDFERTQLIRTRWFRTLIRRALESKFYGYSLIFIQEASQGNITKIIDVPRENVIPEKGIILKNGLDPSGESIKIADYPYHFVYIQLADAIGKLEQVAPLTIFKRHSWAAWDEFEQIFGVPLRIARTMIDTPKHKADLQLWLETMGLAGYIILDKRVDIDIKENNRSDAFNVFAQKISLINKEISKAILGQTMTMDDGGSYSQAEIHLQTLDDITNADITDVEDWFNNYFITILRGWGYDLPEGYWLDIVANASVNPAEKIKVDEALMRNGWNLDKDYIEQTYEVKLDADNPRNNQPQVLNYNKNAELDFFV